MNDVYFRGSNKYYKSKMEKRVLDLEEEMDQQQLQQEQEEHRH